MYCRGEEEGGKEGGRIRKTWLAIFFFEGSARGGRGGGRFMIVESDIGREILGFIAFSEEQKENF